MLSIMLVKFYGINYLYRIMFTLLDVMFTHFNLSKYLKIFNTKKKTNLRSIPKQDI